MNKCEKYFWKKYEIKDTFFGAKFSLYQEFYKLIKIYWKKFKIDKFFKIKSHNYRIMNFIGIYK